MPSDHITQLFDGITKSPSESHSPLEQETYIIHLPNPKRYPTTADLAPNKTISFLFQRYHREPDGRAFDPVFEEALSLTLHTIRLRNKPGRSRSFPYLLDTRPEVSLYTNVCQTNHDDPILRMLSSNLRMTFRYSVDEGIGYLVHTGYDWPHIDDTSLVPLWRTAINLSEDHPPA